jgi:hypothetical protein
MSGPSSDAQDGFALFDRLRCVSAAAAARFCGAFFAFVAFGAFGGTAPPAAGFRAAACVPPLMRAMPRWYLSSPDVIKDMLRYYSCSGVLNLDLG